MNKAKPCSVQESDPHKGETEDFQVVVKVVIIKSCDSAPPTLQRVKVGLSYAHYYSSSIVEFKVARYVYLSAYIPIASCIIATCSKDNTMLALVSIKLVAMLCATVLYKKSKPSL